MNTFGEGDRILHHGRSGKIVGTSTENGRAVYTAELEDGDLVWDYEDQFVLISSYDGPSDFDIYNGPGMEGGVRFGTPDYRHLK